MMILDSKMTVSDLLRVHPSVMDVFIKRKMLCVGCPTESFHTLEDVAHIYGIALTQLLKELRGAINAKGNHERIR
jgi:hybrid cluster-associated redox disulfide protein